MKSVCVFCGSRTGVDPAYASAALALGALLARRGLRLVYGGGRVGLMGLVADAALQSGGEVVGIIPTLLIEREVEHRGLTELHEVDSMHKRKAMMESLSDAFIVLPGGLGTLDEACEILTWAQLGLHKKPLAILNTNGYYDSLLTFLDYSVSQHFLPESSRNLIIVDVEPEAMLDRLFGN
jgi:uncharacterized protein (TIGR00730 family)